MNTDEADRKRDDNDNNDQDGASPNQTCAVCDNPATIHCFCHGSPAYIEGELLPAVYYCSDNCRNSRNQLHISECDKLQRRKQLLNVGKLLTECHLQFRANVFSTNFSGTRCVRADGTNWVTIYMDNPSTVGYTMDTIDPSLIDVGSQPYMKGILTCGSCCQSLIVWQDWLLKALQGIAVKITDLEHQSTNRTVNIGYDYRREAYHAIWAIDTCDGESWAIDLTASQHGHRDGVLPLQKFIDERASGIDEVRPFGSYASDRVKRNHNAVANVNSCWNLCQNLFIQDSLDAFFQDLQHQDDYKSILDTSKDDIDVTINRIAERVGTLVRDTRNHGQTADIDSVKWLFNKLMRRVTVGLARDMQAVRLHQIMNERLVGPPTSKVAEIMNRWGIEW